MTNSRTTQLRRLFRPAPCRPSHRTRLGLEPLDARIAPAVTFLANGSTLAVTSDSAADNVEVRLLSQTANTAVVSVLQNGTLLGTRSLVSPANVPVQAVANLTFHGNAGDDTFRNLTPFPSVLTGGAGNDTLTGGTGTDTVAETGNVDFTLTNTSLTGQGNDTLTSIEKARLTGGPGANALNASAFSGNVILDGGAGADNLRGGAGDDVLTGGLGDDVLNGGPGDDTVDETGNVNFTLTNTGLTGLGTDTLASIKHARLTGGAGNNILDASAFTNGAVTLNGEAGNDLLQGGSHSDVLNGGAGDDVLMRSGGSDDLNGDAGTTRIFGLVRRHLTPNELGQNGNLRAALVGNTLTVAGPSGAGFEIVGSWSRTATPSQGQTASEVFSASGGMILKTAVGDLPFLTTASVPLRFTVSPDTFPNFGDVTAVVWNVGPAISSIAGALTEILEEFGIGLTLPTVTWGLKLGRDLGSLNAPLNAAVPYVHFTITGNFSVTYNGETHSAGLGKALTFVFDPSDPFLFVRVTPPPGSPIVTFATAVSRKGHIPFTQQTVIPNVQEKIFGNAFAAGTVRFEVQGVPVKVIGSAVLDLDANDDGVRLNPNAPISRLFFNLGLPGSLNDVRLGANGALELDYHRNGHDLDLPMAAGSVIYRPGLLAFKGGTINPLAGTPLSFITPLIRVDIEGNISNGAIFVRVEFDRGRFLGLPASRQFVEFRNSGVTAKIDLTGIPGFGILSVSGSINAQGRFSLTGAVDSEFPPCGFLPVCFTFPGHLSATVSNMNGSLSFTGTISGGVLMDNLGVRVRGDVSASVSFTLSGTSLQASGTGTATVTATFLGVSLEVSGSITVNNQGVKVCASAFGLTPCYTFSFPPAFRGRTITPRAAAGELVTVTGIIVVTDPTKDFFLDVAWGDGTPVETFTFPPSSDGQQVSVTHRYAVARRTAVSNDYTVALLWRDLNGGSNADALTVTITNPPLTAAERYVARLYTDVLGREADASGLDSWSDLLDGGLARGQVVSGFLRSREYTTLQIQTIYATFLKRPAETYGLESWLRFVEGGGTLEQVRAGILGSEEYYQTQGGDTDDGFLQAVYFDVLSRPIEPYGLVNQALALGRGVSRGQVAEAIGRSEEFAGNRTRAFYQDYLSRPADDDGLRSWVETLRRGTSEVNVIRGFLGSEEYFGRTA